MRRHGLEAYNGEAALATELASLVAEKMRLGERQRALAQMQQQQQQGRG